LYTISVIIGYKQLREIRNERRKTNMKNIKSKKQLGVAIIIVLLLLVFSSDSFKDGYKEGTKETSQTTELSPEKKYSNWVNEQVRKDGSSDRLIMQVQNGLKNPDSFKIISMKHAVGEDYIVLEMTYRATNSFNAIVTENVQAMIDYKTNELTIISQG
jgi:hypothetical protein